MKAIANANILSDVPVFIPMHHLSCDFHVDSDASFHLLRKTDENFHVLRSINFTWSRFVVPAERYHAVVIMFAD